MIDLVAIKVLYRQPMTLALYGIPYELRPGQQPRDIERGQEEAVDAYHRASARGLAGARFPPPLGWTWLGSPGWWGNTGPDDRAAIEAWLRERGDLVPQNPGEWARVE